MKTSLVQEVSKAKHHSVRMLIGFAAIFGFRLYNTDVIQAYLQSADKLMRDVFINAPKEFELNKNQIMKLLKPLYGLSDSGDYWDKTMSDHLRNELGMNIATGGDGLFFKALDKDLKGICATYVDVALFAGNKEFQEESEVVRDRFECKETEWGTADFAGMKIEDQDNGFIIHQKRYISKIKPLQNFSNFTDFRSLRAKLSWVTKTRPDIACSAAQSAQITDI